MSIAKRLLGAASFVALSSVFNFIACSSDSSSSNDVAGGVTDIGNSIAYSGMVLSDAGGVVPQARVVAYYDSWEQTSVRDSVVTTADENGAFSLQLDSGAAFVLFASNGEQSGIARNGDRIVIGSEHIFSGHVAGKKSGHMRVVGNNETAPLDADGYFIFYQLPPGEISLTYVQDDAVVSRMELSIQRADSVVVLPELSFLQGDNSWMTVRDSRYYAGLNGVQIRTPESSSWSPVVEVPEDSLNVLDSVEAPVVKVKVPKLTESLNGFLFPIKVNTKSFDDTAKLSDMIVVNQNKWEMFPSEIEYWNDDEALVWVRTGEEIREVEFLELAVVESAEYAAMLIPFDLGQAYDGVLTKTHFNGDAKVLDEDGKVATELADSAGFLGAGATLKPGQYLNYEGLDPCFGDATISLWTKWEGVNGKRQVLTSQRGDSTYRMQWRFDEKDGFSLMEGFPGATDVVSFGGAELVSAGEWTHLALVSKDGVFSMFVNGKQVGEPQRIQPFFLGKQVPLHVGGSGVADDTWNGALDEFRIETTARSAAWIKAVYETQKAAIAVEG